jgi:hypothetical protein
MPSGLDPVNHGLSQSWAKLNLSYTPKKIAFAGNIVPPPLPVPLWPLSFIYATFINYSVITPAVYVSGWMETSTFLSNGRLMVRDIGV